MWMCCPIRQFGAGQHVFHSNDEQTHLYSIANGALRLYHNLADGRRQIVGFAFAGDLAGADLQARHQTNGQAIVPTRLYSMSKSMFLRLVVENPKLLLGLHEALSTELAAAQELALTIGQRSSEEALAAFIVGLARRNARQGLSCAVISLPMSRRDIADYLGLTIGTVSRTFTKFKNHGLIELTKRRSLHILDIATLERLMEGTEWIR